MSFGQLLMLRAAAMVRAGQRIPGPTYADLEVLDRIRAIPEEPKSKRKRK